MTVGLARSLWPGYSSRSSSSPIRPAGSARARARPRRHRMRVHARLLRRAALFYRPQTRHEPWFPGVAHADPFTHVGWRNPSGLRQVRDWSAGRPDRALPGAAAAQARARDSSGAHRRSTACGRRLRRRRSVRARDRATLFAGSSTPGRRARPGSGSSTFAGLAISLSLSAGLLWGGAGRGAVADLVVELERTPPGSVRDALARALGDPTLELGLWLPERSGVRRRQGPAAPAAGAGSVRAVTVLGPAELRSPRSSTTRCARAPGTAHVGGGGGAARARERAAAGRAARCNSRSSAPRGRASSRAGDEERRRLERNLHDGAQQRLLSLGLAMQLIRAELGPDANGAAGAARRGRGGARAALEELREPPAASTRP